MEEWLKNFLTAHFLLMNQMLILIFEVPSITEAYCRSLISLQISEWQNLIR